MDVMENFVDAKAIKILVSDVASAEESWRADVYRVATALNVTHCSWITGLTNHLFRPTYLDALSKRKSNMQINSTQDLRQILISTIGDIRAGTVAARDATAIASLAGKILQSAKLDLDCARFQASLEGSSAANSTPKPLQLVDAVIEPQRGRPRLPKQAI